MLGHVRIAAGHQQGPARPMCSRGPHLLTVDHPVIAVAYRAGGQARQIGAGARLAEELTPQLFTGEQGTQDSPGQFRLPMRKYRRRRHAIPDHIDK
ncbi:Uncharacterised protein [Mycobacteroides abscessus subsp. abscessus]|nr:Uncharacterised protein [Mycobacteroides abscessus subsp. abscessus]